MNDVPRVSVVVPCYNAGRWIGECLRSVFAQDADELAGRVEVIVVDDGSTDSTCEVASAFPRCTLIRTDHRGASHARNQGTAAARGEYLQYVDADDFLKAGKLVRQVAALEASGADAAYGDYQALNVAADGQETPGEIIGRPMQRDPDVELFDDFWCPPAAYLFRRSIVEKVGGWNERLPIIQDARFALDIALHGGRFVYTPGIVAYYRTHTDKQSLSRRDPIAFHRDIYRNAREVEAIWRARSSFDETRRNVVLKVLSYVIRACYRKDDETCVQALHHARSLDSRFVPAGPAHFQATARLLGYQRAETLGAIYRRLKAVFR